MFDDMTEFFLYALMCVLASALVLVIGAIVIHTALYKCTSWGKEYRHAWVSVVMAGKVAVPIHHPAGWYDTCLKYEKRDWYERRTSK